MYKITKAIIEQAGPLVLATDPHNPLYGFQEDDVLTIKYITDSNHSTERYIAISPTNDMASPDTDEASLVWEVSVADDIWWNGQSIDIDSFTGDIEQCIVKGLQFIEQYRI